MLHIDDFNRKYPIGPKLSQGTYGTVYLSGEDTVIKQQKTTWDGVKPSLIELDAYQRFNTPVSSHFSIIHFLPMSMISSSTMLFQGEFLVRMPLSRD